MFRIDPETRKVRPIALRREKKIPAVLYSNGKPGDLIAVDAIEFQKLLNHVKKGPFVDNKDHPGG